MVGEQLDLLGPQTGARKAPSSKGKGAAKAANETTAARRSRSTATAKKKAPATRAAKTATPKTRSAAKAPAARTVAKTEESPAPRRTRTPRAAGSTAEDLAQRQREISVSEFFSKNRHLLGFDSPSKALLTTVKEAVDNSLDACEEAHILPEIVLAVRPVEGAADRWVVSVEDNGPGILKAQVPKIFGKLLYGSKFHRLKQSRGQQGIGISAAAMYGQLTTGKPVVVWTRTGKGKKAHRMEIRIDTRTNNPVVVAEEEVDFPRPHGTRVEIEMQADYSRGQRHLLRYVEQTVLANPHLALTFERPNAEPLVFPRASEEPPKEALEIKPHPHGVEVGALMLMAKESKARSIASFLQTEFSRVSAQVAEEILRRAGLRKNASLRDLAEDREIAEKLRQGIVATKIMAPPMNCLSPIGDELIRKGLISFLRVVEEEEPEEEPPARGKRRSKAKEKSAEERQAELERAAADSVPPEEGEEEIKGKRFFIVSTTRPPKVYRGNPFQVEVGLAYSPDWPQDKTIELYRFANRVPLLFQRGACGITEAVVKTDWRKYELSQPRGALPVGPMALLVHIASVWVPFTSESKEAIAHYPELLSEIRLALQECGRKLAAFIRKRKAAAYELKRRSTFELYIEEVARSLHLLAGVDEGKVKSQLLDLARRATGGDETDEILDRVVRRPKYEFEETETEEEYR
jgi:DNA topoisomerase-6 subunit B